MAAPLDEGYPGPIDIRQNLDAAATFGGPLELGDKRVAGVLEPKSVVVSLSYTWAPLPPFGPGKDHPDPEMFYLRLVQRVLGHMYWCIEFAGGSYGYTNKLDDIFIFWVRASRSFVPRAVTRPLPSGLDVALSELQGRSD